MTAPSDQDEWSQEDILTLTESMKARLPANDDKMYKFTQSRLDWDKVAFKHYTGPMCRQKWNEVSNHIRKCRTLTEMILDAVEHVKNPYEGKKILNHPDFPKKPQKPYNRFFWENKEKYKKLEPDMRYADLDKMLTIIYKELPEETKNKYVEAYLREKQEYDSKLAKFREEHPDLIQSTKKSKTPKAAVLVKTKAAIPETPKIAVPLKTKAAIQETPKNAVPLKTKAAIQETPKNAVPLKTKAAIQETPKNAVPLKTKAAIQETPKVAVPLKTKAAIQETPKIDVPLKTKAAIQETPKIDVPLKTKAAIQETPKIDVPLKTKAAIQETPKIDVPLKTKAAIQETPKVAVPVKTKVAVSKKTKVALSEEPKTPQQLKSSAKQKTSDSAKKRKTVTPSKTTENHRKMKRSKMSL